MQRNPSFAGAARALSHLLWAASVRLEQLTQEKDYDQVFFLSREGLIMFHAHRTLYDRRARQKMSYLFASRRSLGLATCWKLSDCFQLLNTPFHPQPVGQLLSSRFGLRPSQGVGSEIIVSRHEKSLIRRHIKRRASEILSRAKYERHSYLAYLARRGVRPGGRYLLVDIGYSGTYHRAFERLIPNARFDSFCVAAFSGAADLVQRGCMHLLLEGVRDNRLKWDFFSRNVACVELLLMAPHPSFISVEDLGCGDFKYQFDSAAQATPREIIQIQKEALALLCCDKRLHFEDQVRASVDIFEKWLSEPPVADVMALSGLALDDRYGGRHVRPLIVSDLLPQDRSTIMPFDAAVAFYESADWKDGALVILRKMSIDAPIHRHSGGIKDRWKKKLRKIFRSKEAFLHHINIFILKRLRRYEAPVTSRDIISRLVASSSLHRSTRT